ncbi:MAG: Ig-like domain-containing protein, partial [Prolixibacteraceae bacterium]|nr:Ig-like domain-containing protein [Prolixibacteraceae bacterium]
MKIYKLFAGIILSFYAFGTTSIFAQSGDQILDGIGETGLIARYTFEENAKDWSRNNLHGNINGSGFSFIDDEQFGKVLSLSGESETFVSIPGESVTGEEALSITGWIYLRSTKSGQMFFDFGKNGQSHFFAAPCGIADNEGCQVQIATQSDKYMAVSPAVTPYKWNHLAIVVNVPAKTLSTFLNGKLVSGEKKLDVELDQLFDYNSAKNNKLFIGKSINDDKSYLNAKLFDFRIYRIPLNEGQIAGIYNSALKKDEAVVGTRVEPDRDVPKFPETTPQLYNAYLVSVPDIRAETVVGHLPRLPRFVKGVYSHGIEGPKVRVLWPAPENNNEVINPGTYTITGRVAGTDLQPKVIVTVKNSKETATPKRILEAFSLEQVQLNDDIHNNKTKFIENRDKFITVLAHTNPDNFLYMFRNAFGQEQPEGAEPLG